MFSLKFTMFTELLLSAQSLLLMENLWIRKSDFQQFFIYAHLSSSRFSLTIIAHRFIAQKPRIKRLNICGCSWNAKHNELSFRGFCWKSAQQISALLSKIVYQIFCSCSPFALDSLARTEKIPRLNSFKVELAGEKLCSNSNNGGERFSSGFSPHPPNWPERAHHKSLQWTSFLINKFAFVITE